jgi:hypothetical protein
VKQWSDLPDDDELGRADDLLDQADALLRRHRGEAQPVSDSVRTPAPTAAFDDDDLPILTEIVEDLDLPAEVFQPAEPARELARTCTPPVPPAPAMPEQPAPTVPSQPAAPTAPPLPGPASQTPGLAPPAAQAVAEQRLAERLIALDTAIARELEEWAARELPQIIDRELDRLGERIQDEALAHLRATLLPEISARVSSLFEDASPNTPPAL